MKIRNAGFSTVEVLVAFTILSGTIALSMTSYAQGLRGLRDAQKRLDATSFHDAFDFGSLQDQVHDEQASDLFETHLDVQPIDEKPIGLLHPKLLTLRVYGKDYKLGPVLEISTIVISSENK